MFLKQRAVLYLRLSREDEEGRSESQSIANQRAFLLRYAAENDMTVVDTYIDDGFTGTNFNRPGFRRMISDIESGLIDIVLVKDLSRLGRDHIDTGYYYERYFPSRKIRFIAVNDGIDTERETAGNDMGLFKAAFNDLYAKDISKKVITALQSKKRGGEFIGALPPYGYQKSAKNKNKLEPKSEEAAVVQKIYEWRLQGESYIGIARRLNSQGVPPPSARKGKTASGWNDTSVKRILTNPTYCGNLTQNRSRKINYKVDRRKTLPPEEWIIVQNTHEPLVSEKLFQSVQNSVEKRKTGTYPLSGLLYCAECGSRMTFISRGRNRYAVCGQWKRSGGQKCFSHCCNEKTLNQVVRARLCSVLQKETGISIPSSLEDENFFHFMLEKVELNQKKELSLWLRFNI